MHVALGDCGQGEEIHWRQGWEEVRAGRSRQCESKEEKPKEGEIRTSMRGEPRVTLVNPTQWSSRPPFGPKVSLHSGDPQPQRIT